MDVFCEMDSKNEEKSKGNVEIFKYFEKPKKSKTSKSPNTIKMQNRKTRLKSDVFVENMRGMLLTGQYDITKEDSDSIQLQNHKSYKTPPKNVDRFCELEQERSLSRSFSNESPECNVSVNEIPVKSLELETLKTNADDTSPNCMTAQNHTVKKRGKKRKLTSQEMADNLLETIDTNAIADMVVSTDIDEERQTLADNSPNKNEKRTKGSKKIKRTKNCKLILKNDGDISLAKIDHGIETNRKVLNVKDAKEADETTFINNITTEESLQGNANNGTELNVKVLNAKEVKDADESFSGTVNNSAVKENNDIESNRTVSKAKEAQNSEEVLFRETRTFTNNVRYNEKLTAKEKNEEGDQISSVVSNSTTKSIHSNSILKRFPVKNNLNEKGDTCKNSPKKQKVQRSDHISHSGKSNNLNLNKSSIGSKEQNSNGSKAKEAKDVEDIPMPAKRARGRPRLSKQRISKINVSRPIGVKKYTKISKMTKEQIKTVSSRKIPKNRLDDVLNMIDDDNHAIWDDRNTSCNPCIFLHWNPRSSINSDQNIKIKYARQFLLQRNWMNLSKVLGLFNATSKGYYPLLVKYATLLLAHTDKEQFNKFIQFLTKFNDTSAVMEKCTNMATKN